MDIKIWSRTKEYQDLSRIEPRPLAQLYGTVVRGRKATFYKRDFVVLGKPLGYFRLLLPRRLDDDRVRRIAVGIYPTDIRLTEAHMAKRRCRLLSPPQQGSSYRRGNRR